MQTVWSALFVRRVLLWRILQLKRLRSSAGSYRDVGRLSWDPDETPFYLFFFPRNVWHICIASSIRTSPTPQHCDATCRGRASTADQILSRRNTLVTLSSAEPPQTQLVPVTEEDTVSRTQSRHRQTNHSHILWLNTNGSHFLRCSEHYQSSPAAVSPPLTPNVNFQISLLNFAAPVYRCSVTFFWHYSFCMTPSLETVNT